MSPMQRNRILLGPVVVVLAGFLAVMTLIGVVQAQEVEPAAVNVLIVTDDLNPGAVIVDGKCSVVEAIENANADAQVHVDCPAGSGADTIRLKAGAEYQFNTVHNVTGGANALPVITSTITVEGNGAGFSRIIVDGVPPMRFFHVAAGGNLTLLNLNLRYGAVGVTGTLVLPAVGGAILNEGTTQVVGGSMSYNSATYGGAIFNAATTGTLTVTGTLFLANEADAAGGALYNGGRANLAGADLRNNQAGTAGGAIYNGGTASLAAAELRSNQAVTAGGAIYNDSAPLTLTNSTLSGNSSSTGGALAAYAESAGSTVLVEDSRILSNTAETDGGGIWNAATGSFTASLTVRTTAVTGNQAASVAAEEGRGGGIGNYVDPAALPANAQLTVERSLLAGNQAQTGGGLFNFGGDVTAGNTTVSDNLAQGSAGFAGGYGGGIANTGNTAIVGTVILVNNTVVSNTASLAGGGLANVGLISGTSTLPLATAQVGNSLWGNNQVLTSTFTTCAFLNGGLTSLGHNIEDTNTCIFDEATDQPNTEVAVEPLEDNGGPTLTRAIPVGSAAFNAGSNALCSAPPVNGVDQRGGARPIGAACDVGAYEATPRYFLPIILKEGTTEIVLP